MTTLDGRAILVTGGSSGIGEGVALRLGRAGARVGVGYHSGEERAQDVVRRIEEAGGRAIAVGGDVSDEADVERTFGRFLDAYGRIDGVVINAGLQADADLTEMSLEQWRKVMKVDLDGAFLCARAALRHMKDQEPSGGIRAKGALVFVSSVHQFIPWAGHTNYAAAKGGVQMFMQSVAQEVAAQGVRVNAVAPGAIATAINEDVWSDEDKRRELLKLIPYGRLGEPEDVAHAVAWLMSDEADYVTGVTLTIDGGMSLYPGFIGNG
ncbi:glucose 1-dehydrogenase [Parvularcula dongshanensis]|uniref:Glucose 1-dehydrogenase n=1 Tax=Parvularcula dongshanensis TaxID=1173995 RepID=A0A840I0F3_9PROT|nr:glucose 1-dehydrogenase [Parvularcula dongshanensis]MBB4657590.1 glucose 1-dehydrogenase [Parvularcula dongshanensis]